MFNLDKFISDSVTFPHQSMFLKDIEANRETLTREIKRKEDLRHWRYRFHWFQLH